MRRLNPRGGYQEEAFITDAWAVFVGGAPYNIPYEAPRQDGTVEKFTLPALSVDRNIVEKMLADIGGTGKIVAVTVMIFPKTEEKERPRIEVPRLIIPEGVVKK